MRREWTFVAALLAAVAVGVALAGTPAGAGTQLSARVGVGVSAVAALGVLALKAVAVRRSVQAALGFSVLGFFVRLAVWAVGFGWVRSRGLDAGAYTLGFFGLFVVALCLEVTYVLVAAKGLRRA